LEKARLQFTSLREQAIVGTVITQANKLHKQGKQRLSVDFMHPGAPTDNTKMTTSHMNGCNIT